MKLVTCNALSYYSFASMEGEAGLIQAAFARKGGTSHAPFDSLNVSFGVEDDRDKVMANRGLMAESVGLGAESIVSARQVHGRRVVAVESGTVGGQDVPDTDALVTNVPGILLLLKFADCVPITLWDPIHKVVGLAHAGWKGTLLRVPAATVRHMGERYGSSPAEILAGIGPSIGPCCYEVGADVANLAMAEFPDRRVIERRENGKFHLDLWTANVESLKETGIHPERIEVSTLCTRCRDDLFFSHRASGGRTGRFGVVAAIKDG